MVPRICIGLYLLLSIEVAWLSTTAISVIQIGLLYLLYVSSIISKKSWGLLFRYRCIHIKSTLRLFCSAFNINSSSHPFLSPAGAGLPRGTPISSSLGHRAIASSTLICDCVSKSGSLNPKTCLICPVSLRFFKFSRASLFKLFFPQIIGTNSTLSGIASFNSLFHA